VHQLNPSEGERFNKEREYEPEEDEIPWLMPSQKYAGRRELITITEKAWKKKMESNTYDPSAFRTG